MVSSTQFHQKVPLIWRGSKTICRAGKGVHNPHRQLCWRGRKISCRTDRSIESKQGNTQE